MTEKTLQTMTQELILWGMESEQNKQQAINAACQIIGMLNSGKRISNEDLKKISAADFTKGPAFA